MVEGNEVLSDVGAVAAGPEEAARVGARILEQGGNAFDAAAATSMACCMLQPQSTGVGGYVCCAVVLEGKTGTVWSLDANSIAPAAAHDRMFEVLRKSQDGKSLNEREYDCRVRDDANVHGPLAVGPPGMMAGMGTLWEQWGRLKWADIVAPSQKLLDDGFPYRSTANAIKALEQVIRRFQPTTEHLMPSGGVPAPDDIWHRRDMEKTLARIATAGWRDFYDGEIGRQIADAVQSAGGILTRDDMAAYQRRVTEPYTITYRNATVHGPILTNGCLTCLQALNMLECFEPSPVDAVEHWHRLAEVLKLAWRDRLLYLADPDFVHVPVERLLSKDYAAGRVETIRQFPDHVDTIPPSEPADPGSGTLHVSTADAEGNVASVTISQGGAFGSCFTVPGTGIILGHGMCRLDPHPGRANSIGPRKRPLNNTGTLLIQLPGRDVAAGLPGGRRIICVMPHVAQLLVDHAATGLEAATAPRLHVETREPITVTESLAAPIIDGLRALGHQVATARGIAGAVHCAEFLREQRQVRAGGNTWAAGVG